MAIIVDRRKTANRDRTSENRGRLLRRYKSTIKEQLPKILGDRKLLDTIKSGGGTVVLPKKDLSEPQFVFGQGGIIDSVRPGNKQWTEHDTINKPPGGEGGGSGEGGDGEDGLDTFKVILSREEFLNILFEDCELPFMVDTLLDKMVDVEHETAGYQVSGSPNRLSVIRSYKHSKMRRMGIGSMIDSEIEELEREIESLEQELFDVRPAALPNLKALLATKHEQLEGLKIRKHALPLFDTSDLRYRCRVEKKVPKTHATMIMIMDNSGSMGEREKTIARKFFILLYLFLEKNYDQIDLRFISHTTTAKEMGEEEFFNTHENGGTIVSAALDKLVEIIKPLVGKTNIYVAQVSDGDNTSTDNGTCSELLTDDILPFINYLAYVQVEQEHSALNGLLSYAQRNSLWATYEGLAKAHRNMAAKKVGHERDIFGVFHSFFKTKAPA